MSSLMEKLGFAGLLLCIASIGVYGQRVGSLDAFFDPAANETTVYLSQKNVPLTTYQPEGFIPPDAGMYLVKPEALLLTVFFKTPGSVPTVPGVITLRFESRSSGDFRYK